MILRGDSEKFEKLGKQLSKIVNILTHWSVAQAGGRNDENNWRPKILLDCPFKMQILFEYLQLEIVSLNKFSFSLSVKTKNKRYILCNGEPVRMY